MQIRKEKELSELAHSDSSSVNSLADITQSDFDKSTEYPANMQKFFKRNSREILADLPFFQKMEGVKNDYVRRKI